MRTQVQLDGFSRARMRIGLNLLQARSRMGGGWQYIASIVRALENCDKDNDYIAYCNGESRTMMSRRENVRMVLANGFGSNQIGRLLYENSWLQYRAWRDRVDVMHWFGNAQSVVSTTPAAITVHDLIPFEDPGAYDRVHLAYARFAVPRSVSRAAVVLPVSRATANGLAVRFKVAQDRMFVVPYPLEQCWRRADTQSVAGLRQKYALPEKFWLYVAHGYPHKNHRNLSEAYSLLRKRDPNTWPLVLRGEERSGGPKFRELAAEFGIADYVVRLPVLDWKEMPLLYSAATALIYPSKAEGQGLPLMEALACGCPTVASDIPTTRDLCNSQVLLCNPEDPESISAAMSRLQEEPGLLLEYAKKAEGFAESFRPERVVSTLLDAYRAAAGS